MTSEFGTFEATRQAKAYKRCLEYAQGFNPAQPQGYPSLLMFSAGSWGVGKSHLSCAIIHHVLNKWDGVPRERPVLFITEPQLFLRLKATFNVPDGDRTWRETEDDVMKELTTVPLLVLDDVGKMEQSDMRFVQRTLFAVIDGRYSNQLPMVITANLDGQGIREHLGAGRGNEASFDRLVEMTGGKFHEMKGASYRRNTK
jgi:DNA replication protein DnaC